MYFRGGQAILPLPCQVTQPSPALRQTSCRLGSRKLMRMGRRCTYWDPDTRTPLDTSSRLRLYFDAHCIHARTSTIISTKLLSRTPGGYLRLWDVLQARRNILCEPLAVLVQLLALKIPCPRSPDGSTPTLNRMPRHGGQVNILLTTSALHQHHQGGGCLPLILVVGLKGKTDGGWPSYLRDLPLRNFLC